LFFPKKPSGTLVWLDLRIRGDRHRVQLATRPTKLYLRYDVDVTGCIMSGAAARSRAMPHAPCRY